MLEAGTGTGYNAALLCHRLGHQQVTTVEIDEQVHATAVSNLARCGYAPAAHCGDAGTAFDRDRSFDRVIATFAIKSVPHAWITRTCPGGVIVTPWRNHLRNEYLLRLEVGRDGTATGALVGGSAFMLDRNQRHEASDVELDGDYVESTTAVGPHWLTQVWDVNLYIGTRVPDCCFWQDDLAETPFLGVEDSETGSWAQLLCPVSHPEHTDEWTVRQHGPRALWDEIERAMFTYFDDAGQPGSNDWIVTVNAGGLTLRPPGG